MKETVVGSIFLLQVCDLSILFSEDRESLTNEKKSANFVNVPSITLMKFRFFSEKYFVNLRRTAAHNCKSISEIPGIAEMFLKTLKWPSTIGVTENFKNL